MIAIIAGSFILWFITERFWPRIFDPWQYWCLTDNIITAVAQSWPLYLYGLAITVIILRRAGYLDSDDKVSLINIYSSVMAGIIEEIGYRCIFIFTSMISIILLKQLIPGIVTWYYNTIFFITDIVTLGLMHNTIYGFPEIFMAAALSANIAFRDGHKYQETLGLLNAWFIGLYLLQIMLTKGLVIAILVHTIYDLTIDFTKYFYDHTGVKTNLSYIER